MEAAARRVGVANPAVLADEAWMRRIGERGPEASTRVTQRSDPLRPTRTADDSEPAADRLTTVGLATVRRGVTDSRSTNPYDVDFDWETAHGRLVSLLVETSLRGIVVDLGCGFAPLAGPLIEAGFGYVGFDVDPDSIDAVRACGHDARLLDLSAVERVTSALESVRVESDLPIVAVDRDRCDRASR